MRYLDTKEIGGFTLTEIIVTIIIAGVLGSLAIPRFNGIIERAHATEGVRILTALLRAQKAYKMEKGDYTAVLADLDIEITRVNGFYLPPGVANPDNPVNDPIATISRLYCGSATGYALGINEEGAITCTDGDMSCAKAGF